MCTRGINDYTTTTITILGWSLDMSEGRINSYITIMTYLD